MENLLGSSKPLTPYEYFAKEVVLSLRLDPQHLFAPAEKLEKISKKRWAALSAKDKGCYVKHAEDAKAKFDAEVAAFTAAGGVLVPEPTEEEKREEKKLVKRVPVRTAKRQKTADPAKGQSVKPKTQMIKLKAPADPDRPKRPMHAMFLYIVSIRPKLMKMAVRSSSTLTDTTKEIAARWRHLPSREKGPYIKAAKAMKEQYHQEMNEWRKRVGRRTKRRRSSLAAAAKAVSRAGA